jgi:hypothetical protein
VIDQSVTLPGLDESVRAWDARPKWRPTLVMVAAGVAAAGTLWALRDHKHRMVRHHLAQQSAPSETP